MGHVPERSEPSRRGSKGKRDCSRCSCTVPVRHASTRTGKETSKEVAAQHSIHLYTKSYSDPPLCLLVLYHFCSTVYYSFYVYRASSTNGKFFDLRLSQADMESKKAGSDRVAGATRARGWAGFGCIGQQSMRCNGREIIVEICFGSQDLMTHATMDGTKGTGTGFN